MAKITNIRKFMDGDKIAKKMPAEAKEQLAFLSAIIEEATLAYGQQKTVSIAGCRNDNNGDICFGDIEVWVYAENNHIGWKCIKCGNDGVITDWEGTPWDKRNYTRH